MSRCDDYCCNHGCNQGRDCPARKPVCAHCFGIGYDASGQRCTCVTAARVAKIGRRYPDRSPLRGATLQRHLKELARAFLLLIAVMLATALAAALIA